MNIIETNENQTATTSQSGTYFRFLVDNNQLTLPTEELVAGETEFFVTFAEDGVVEAGEGFEVDYLRNDAGQFEGFSDQNVGNIQKRCLYRILYVGDGHWASNIITNT